MRLTRPILIDGMIRDDLPNSWFGLSFYLIIRDSHPILR